MSDARRLDVLRAIVEDYVQYREPVGSRALVDRHRLGVSSATIRNDMAVLEEEGLIVAPHTSAGRVPTDAGYRLFVDRISDVKPLSPAERRAIQTLLDEANDLDDVMEKTARLLAQLTRQVALIQYPTIGSAHVRHLDVVALTEDRALVVLIASNGHVEQRVVALDEPATVEDLADARTRLLGLVDGRQLTEVPAMLGRLRLPGDTTEGGGPTPDDGTGPGARLLDRLAAAVTSLVGFAGQDRIVMAGTANLARATRDFPLTILPVLEALEEQVVMLRLLSEMGQDEAGVSVRIGHENPYEPLSEASVIASGYGPASASRLGVVGPTRMDYPTSMAAVRAVARYLSRILAG
ncbi:heat-inducible transcription repressor HrcA [Tersicoccus solisilvae]|uniref:Heat-inducible transcription repressor HrcA n=1 Tax=Tersicoccus solisilvae TaxID=1882339 RepID=A0ABQ1NQF9_9MICC|nr:heat-inducible transcriptional repressor HrcA [Tersicoccus solisilvae]GGC82901.1 heat-inducible transcription repressor HrcA [Tersicoccus solisilvae]